MRQGGRESEARREGRVRQGGRESDARREGE